MTHPETTRSGGRILVDNLIAHGADSAFCVPGESYLAVLDALYDNAGLRLTTCRHESGATFMAEAYGKLTGRPGIAFVTRGPGASNASAGVHVARQDSTPMILFIGQVPRCMRDREAFQEVDFAAMYAPLAKWAAQIDDPARIPEYISRAFHTATAGRPGPVVLALPEDVLSETACVADTGPFEPVLVSPASAQVAAVRERLEAAQRPLLLVGGGGWTERAAADIAAFAEASNVPVGTAFRRQDHFDNTHPCYAGHLGLGIDPKLAESVREADLIVAIGPRLGDKTTGGYTLLESPRPRQALVHVHPGPEELGRVYRPDLAVCSHPAAFATALAAVEPIDGSRWRPWRERLRSQYEAHHRPLDTPGPVQLGEIVTWLGQRLGPDAIIANGAGNYAAWVHRHYPYRGFHTQLAPTSGSMGYGLPAALAAKLTCPERDVVCFAGDGCLQMTIQELATAAQYRLGIVVIVVNNGLYGTIRMHQAMHYPGRVKNTELVNPDFVQLARAYGLHGERVERTADFAEAFERALTVNGPALIELPTLADVIAPGRTLSSMEQD